MQIGVKDTQDLIRRIAAESNKELTEPVQLDPQEAGMATGPRIRRRSFMRPGMMPEYVSPALASADTWQRLDDDVYKFLQVRRPQFADHLEAPSHQFIMEVETQFVGTRRDYDPGTFLGLVRLAADLDDTRRTLVTASEHNGFFALARRLTSSRREDEHFDPRQTELFLQLLHGGEPLVSRGMADLLRFMARAARLPLLGSMHEAPSLCLSTFLETVDLAARFNRAGAGRLEFTVSPLDVFLAARSVLFNRSVGNPTFSMIRELVLDPGGLYHDDLAEWLQNVGLFGSDLTVLLPARLSEEGFALYGRKFSALELVCAGGARLVQSPTQAAAGINTLGDAMIHRIQRQDMHKDYQIQSLLRHFNGLLQAERRSAARAREDRQQARFDYMQAIRRAGEAAREMATGTFPVLKPTSGAESELAFEPAAASIHPPSRAQLREWDEILQSLRRNFSSQSPVFRAFIALLARVRALDTALAFGLTPAGSRSLGRLMRLLQNDDVRRPLPLPAATWEQLESALVGRPTVFLASLESLVSAVYGFRPNLEEVQYRYRDRIWQDEPAGEDEAGDAFAHSGAFDESVIGLLVGVLLLELDLFPALDASPTPLPPREPGAHEDPLLAYAAFLQIAAVKERRPVRQDVETAHRLLWAMPSDAVAIWARHRIRLAKSWAAPELPRLGSVALRAGWSGGCERGFMQEVIESWGAPSGEFETRLLARFTEIQSFVDAATAAVAADKRRLGEERLRRALGRDDL